MWIRFQNAHISNRLQSQKYRIDAEWFRMGSFKVEGMNGVWLGGMRCRIASSADVTTAVLLGGRVLYWDPDGVALDQCVESGSISLGTMALSKT